MERGRRSSALRRRLQQLRTASLPGSSSSSSSTSACSSSSSSCSSGSKSSTEGRQRGSMLQTGYSFVIRRSNYTTSNPHDSHIHLSNSSCGSSSNCSSSRRGGLSSFPSALLLSLFLTNIWTSPSSVLSLPLRVLRADTRVFSSPSAHSSSPSFSLPPSYYSTNSLFEAKETAAAATTGPAADPLPFVNLTAAPAAAFPAPALAGVSAAVPGAQEAADAIPRGVTGGGAAAVRVPRLLPVAFCGAVAASPAGAAASARTRRRSKMTARLFAAGAATSALDRQFTQEGRGGDAAATVAGGSRTFMRPRILCTGLGVVNGVGIGVEEFWKNVVAGRNVVGKVTRFDPTGMTCQIACEVSDAMFDPGAFFRDPKEVKRNDRYSHFAMAAARLAMEDAGLGPDGAGLQRDRFGVVIGSGIGGLQWMEQELRVLLQKGPRRVSPLLIPAMIANTASAVVAIDMKAEGPNHGAVSACATSGHATGTALRYLQAGEADIILCGGAEASITPLSFAGFNAMRAMAQGFNDSPKTASRPFDKKRAGFVMGEGAGVMVLETEEHAVRRGASKIYGEVAGYGATCDAHHVTAPAPDGAGLARCLEKAIKEANRIVSVFVYVLVAYVMMTNPAVYYNYFCVVSGVAKGDVGYINAHGTSTPLNDRIETRAFKSVFGEEGAKKLLISSTKSMTGHCLGATGGIEACVAAKVLETGIVPPTINYEEPDPDCDLNYVPNQAFRSPSPFEAVITDTLGFGGHNAALLLRRYRDLKQ